MFTKNSHPSSTSFFQQQQQQTNSNNDDDTALTQEMHVKMAKKIAQLTKVRDKFFLFLYIYYFQIREKKKECTLAKKNGHHVFDKQYTLCNTEKTRVQKKM